MFKFLSRKSKKVEQVDDLEPNNEPKGLDSNNEDNNITQVEPQEQKSSWFSRLKNSLSKTRNRFTNGLADLILGKKSLDNELIEEIETQLLISDVGIETTQKIISQLTQGISRKEIKDPEAVLAALKKYLAQILKEHQGNFNLNNYNKPNVVLMVGINGAGKTTTIGKLASKLKQQGNKVMLAAGDTFRAAAIEQLQAWGDRNEVPVVAQAQGSDSASVLYDALNSATAKQMDVLIADTAGRLHTKDNLMEELKKVKRVMQKIDVNAPHEVLLVLDAGTGQNALLQAQEFNKTIKLTGIVLTKLDGTAKGGIIFTIADQLKLPIYFIGIGEQKEDLRSFNAEEFVAALFGDDSILS
jgi:fused signal recognition particle receptor